MGQSEISILFVLTFWVALALSGPSLQVQDQWISTEHKHGLRSPKDDQRSTPFEIEPRFRLPTNRVETIHYDIKISPILNTAPDGYDPWTAPGFVIITFKSLETVNSITLNKDPTLVKVTAPIKVTKEGGPEVRVIGDAYDPNGLWVISLDTNVEAGSVYLLSIQFVTTMPTTFTGLWSKTGLHGAKYTDENGNDVWLATTQCETVGFRKISPGFDEPHHKAVFDIKIGRPRDNFISLTNSEIVDPGTADSTIPPGYVLDVYNQTVKMSTYLIAIVVSNYKAEEADINILGKPVKVYGPPHLIDHNGGKYAANASAHILKYYEDIMEIKYAMHKMDSIAIPRNYFQFGAMENYGLNTYRDNALLFYPKEKGKSLEVTRRSVSSILAHELAHQWFGNLVTTIWWSHIYLNEGFATYMAYYGVEHIAPEYDSLNQFIYNSVQAALLTDAGPSSHPVINTATEEEILTMTIFDNISYQKGGSLIRMMEGFLTRDTLWRGLIRYLRKMEFSNAHQDDLFSSLTEQAKSEGKDIDVKSIMDTYTLQKGFPLVRVSTASATRIYISQERFTNNANLNKELDPDTLWEVPLAIVTQDSPSFEKLEPVLWIHNDTSLVSHDVSDTGKWIIVNPGGYGYYRVLYDTQLTALIQQQLNDNPTVFDALTRSKLIDDYFRFAEEGYVSWETALGMTKFIGKNPADSDHTFLVPALGTFSGFLSRLNGSNSEINNIKNYLRPKIEAELDHFGWEQGVDEHGIKVLMRATLLDWASTLDSQKLVDLSKALLAQWRSQPDQNPIPLDLQSVVYCSAISSGVKSDFDFIFQQFSLETSSLAAEHRTRLLNSLSCSRSYEQLIWLIRNSVEPTKFGIEYLNGIIMRVHANHIGRELAIGFIRDNWQQLVNYTATDDAKIQTTVISTAVNDFAVYQNSEDHVATLQKLMQDIEAKNKAHYDLIQNSLTASVGKIRANGQWVAANRGPINAWFAVNS